MSKIPASTHAKFVYQNDPAFHAVVTAIEHLAPEHGSPDFREKLAAILFAYRQSFPVLSSHDEAAIRRGSYSYRDDGSLFSTGDMGQ